MGKINKDTLAYLGDDYQLRFIAQILTDRKFAHSIIDIVDPNYFEDPYIRVIAATIKDAKIKDDIVPDFASLEIRLIEEISEEYQRDFMLRQLRKIKEASLYDSLKIQDIAMKFCKQQELKKSIKEIQKIIDKGDIEDYEKCETILKKALEHGDNKDIGIDVFHDIKSVLEDDFRKPIRTGIEGLDEVMDGGLSKTELGVILAPFGVGKTTLMTKIGNTAFNDGYNVLQIFFEDNPKVIQRKHISCWSGIDLNSLSVHKEQLSKMCDEMEANKKAKLVGDIRLAKFSSDGTTIPIIRQYVRKLISEGFRPDIILLDYIDCVQPSRRYDDANVGEGSVMRQLETMLSELDIAGWTAVQGNRSSINANVVEADQMGGSIKKGQIGHFILSIAKTLDQKEDGTATMAVLKSRFGKSGIIWDNIKFDNSSIQIDMGDNTGGKTNSELKKSFDKEKQNRINMVYNANKLRNQLLNDTNTIENELTN